MPSKNLHTLQPGTEMVAAGYCMYGERALFVAYWATAGH